MFRLLKTHKRIVYFQPAGTFLKQTNHSINFCLTKHSQEGSKIVLYEIKSKYFRIVTASPLKIEVSGRRLFKTSRHFSQI